jgi:hypothetical protein
VTRGKIVRLIPGLAVFVASLAYFLSYMHYGFAYDEGYLLDSVERILDGQVIYRDFHHTYAPGGFYLLAALFKIFGKTILLERLVFALLGALRCLLAFSIVRMVTRSRLAYLAPVLAIIAPGPWHKVFFPAFGFLALYAVLLATVRGSRWYLVAGVAIGLAAVFRQDVAGFAVVAAVVGLAVEAWRLSTGLAPALRRLGLLAAGAAAAVAPVVLYFAAERALAPMIHKIAVDGMLDNMTNRIPFPGLGVRAGLDGQYLALVLPAKAIFWLPLAAYVCSAAILMRALARRMWTAGHTLLAMILVASGLAFNQSTFRSDLGHVLQTAQYAFLLVTIVVVHAHRMVMGLAGLGRRARITLAWAVVGVVPAVLVWGSIACTVAATNTAVAARFQREGVSIGDSEYLGSILVMVGNSADLGLARAPLRVTPSEARLFSEIGRFLDANTRAGDYVLAVPQLQTMYFLFDRKNPTRYAHYRRRLAPDEEKRYVEDIRSHGTEYILLTEPYEGARLGQTSESFAEYARPVRDWILANYTAVGRIGWVQILKKKA